VHLLIGNHDKPFLSNDVTWNKIASPPMWKRYHHNRDCFEAAFQHQQYLLTHAGVTQGWYAKHQIQLEAHPGTFADKLNAIHHSAGSHILQERGKARGGNYDFGGIFYADKSETEAGALSGYTQVVGHTKVPQIYQQERNGATMVYIDCLNSQSTSLYIDDTKLYMADTAGNLTPLPVRH